MLFTWGFRDTTRAPRQSSWLVTALDSGLELDTSPGGWPAVWSAGAGWPPPGSGRAATPGAARPSGPAGRRLAGADRVLARVRPGERAARRRGLAGSPGRSHELLGVTGTRYWPSGLADLLSDGPPDPLLGSPGVGSVTTEPRPAGPGGATHPCVSCGVYLIDDAGERFALLLRGPEDGSPDEPVRLQVAGASQARAGQLLGEVRGWRPRTTSTAARSSRSTPRTARRPGACRVPGPAAGRPGRRGAATGCAGRHRAAGGRDRPARHRAAGQRTAPQAGRSAAWPAGDGQDTDGALPAQPAAWGDRGRAVRRVAARHRGSLRDRPGAAAVGRRGRGPGPAGRPGRGDPRPPAAGPAAERDGRARGRRQRDLPAHRRPGGGAGGRAGRAARPDRPHRAAAAARRGRPAPGGPAVSGPPAYRPDQRDDRGGSHRRGDRVVHPGAAPPGGTARGHARGRRAVGPYAATRRRRPPVNGTAPHPARLPAAWPPSRTCRCG